MAKKATPAGGKSASAKKSSGSKSKAENVPARRSTSERSQGSDFDVVDALLNLLKSPLVADLLAVGATAAMAAITESRHSRRAGGDTSKRMMKAAGVAAAAAIGRRLADEFEEIRNVSKRSRERAEA